MMTMHGLDPWAGLKILVSGVQSPPCPPLFSRISSPALGPSSTHRQSISTGRRANRTRGVPTQRRFPAPSGPADSPLAPPRVPSYGQRHQGDPRSFFRFDDSSPTVSTASGVRRDGPGNDERETKLAAMSPRILRAVTIENFGNEGRQRLQEIASLPPPLAHHSPVLVSADELLQ